MARKLNTTVMVDGVIYEAGTPESKVKGKVTAEGVWSGTAEKSAAADAGNEAPKGYSDLKVEDLQAEADKRELEVTGTGKDGNVVKADLVAALEAHDAANSSGGDED